MLFFFLLVCPALSSVTDEGLTITATTSGLSTLRKAIVITRHGDRSPTKNYPTLHQWKILGELTGEGMSQMYHLGSHLRQRYIIAHNYTFLPKEYHLFERSHLLVRATDKDRTLMSANSLLLGLYPPGTGPYRAKGEVSTDEYGLPHNIQVIPIHTEAAKNDRLLYAYKGCPKLKKLQKTLKSSDRMWLMKEEQTLPFREKLSAALGTEVSLDDMSAVYHGIKAEKIHAKSDLSLLGLTEADYQHIIDLKDWTLHRKFWTREMGRLGAGILLKNIIDSFWETANKITLLQQGTEKKGELMVDPIFVYYSGHDGTLLSLFSAMGLQENFDIPHYSSFVIFELHEVNNTFEVVVEYNNKSLLPDCPVKACSLLKFTE